MSAPLSEVRNIDCMEYMRTFPDKAFDLAVVDPPYGVCRFHGHNTFSGAGKLYGRALRRMDTSWDTPPGEEYFTELFRVSKNQIIWGGNYFPLPLSRCWVVWDKQQPWENFSQAELAWTSFDYPAKMYREGTTTTGEKKIHPTQKSVALYTYLYRTFAKAGDKILDTHLGSGSSRIAAWFAGLDFCGCELNADFFAAMEERFKERCLNIRDIGGHEIEQLTLF